MGQLYIKNKLIEQEVTSSVVTSVGDGGGGWDQGIQKVQSFRYMLNNKYYGCNYNLINTIDVAVCYI